MKLSRKEWSLEYIHMDRSRVLYFGRGREGQCKEELLDIKMTKINTAWPRSGWAPRFPVSALPLLYSVQLTAQFWSLLSSTPSASSSFSALS
jgi:hypothetical protein